jgi:hypothetical protein
MENLPIFVLLRAIKDNLAIAIPILLLLLGVLVGYLVLMVRAVIQMLRYEARSVLLVFAFLSMIPFPLVVPYGILILIVWHYHRRDLEARKAAG